MGFHRHQLGATARHLTDGREEITALAISRQPAHRLYYGTNKRHIYRLDSANTGVPQRIDITYSLFPASGYTSCIAVNPQNADELLVVFSNYGVYSLFHSSDAGANWRKVGGNLEQNTGGTGNGPSCRWAKYSSVSDGTVYLVGTSVGLLPQIRSSRTAPSGSGRAARPSALR